MLSSNNDVNIQPIKGDRLFVQIPALSSNVGRARHAVAEFLQHEGWEQTDTDAVMLAVGEAGSNAVCYGSDPDKPSVVSIVCTLLDRNKIQVEVRNPGTSFQPDLEELFTLPGQEATHGRGFALMQFLMDDVQVFQDGSETIVRLTKFRSC